MKKYLFRNAQSIVLPFILGLLISSATAAPALANEDTPAPASEAKAYPRFGLPEKVAMLVDGKKVYQTYCAGCHGVTGEGNGPAAAFLNPKPRNFKTADFRFRSTPSGELPTDEDLMQTLTHGLKGSSMPAWNLLPDYDRRAVIEYLKSFAPEEWEGGHGPVTTIAEDPYGSSGIAEAIKRGQTAYHGMAMCYSCHAAYIPASKINEARAFYKMPPMKAFRNDLGTPKSMTTTEGSVIVPPDFTWHKLKRGTDTSVLYHVIGNGITGTPMPTWKGILPEEDLWGIVYYVQHLADQRKSRVTEADIRDYHERILALETDRVQFEAEMKKADELAAQAKEAADKTAQEAAAAQAPARQPIKETASV